MTIRSPFGTPFMSPLSSFTGTDDELRRFIIDLLKASSTRNSQTTVLGYASDAVYTDDPVLLTVPANLVAIKYGRLVGTEWFDTDINGVKFPNPTELQNYGAGTNQLWPSLTPATQTTASLAIGFYTLSVYGAGSSLASGGTATITGAAAATEGSPNTIEVTVAGTVTVTVSGVLDRFQLEGGSIETSHIITTTAPVTRLADNTTAPTPIVLAPESGAIHIRLKPALLVSNSYVAGFGTDVDNRFGIILSPTLTRFLNRMAGVTTVDILAGFTPDVTKYANIELYWDGVICAIRGYNDGDIAPAFTTAAFSALNLTALMHFGSQGVSGFLLQSGLYANDGVPVCYASKEDVGW